MPGYLYKRGDVWHATYAVNGVRYRRSTKTRNKSDAQKIVDKWIAEAHLSGNGLPVGKATWLLVDLIKEYEQWLCNRSDVHQSKSLNRINRVVGQAGWKTPREITHLSCEQAIRKLDNERDGSSLSATTIRHYMTAMKSFTRWLTKLKKCIPVDPLDDMKKPSSEEDRKRVRRFLLPEEWTWLKTTPNAILYQTAIETGFRASELLAIEPHHLKGDHILLPAKFTKNNKTAKQWISADLSVQLAKVLPFDYGPWFRAAEQLAEDLALARQAYENAGGKDAWLLNPVDAEGHVLDFHALRHTTGAWLCRAGVNIKSIQAIMRHSSITLTLDTYGHLLPGDTEQAAKVLHSLCGRICDKQQPTITPLPYPDDSKSEDTQDATSSRKSQSKPQETQRK